jgi:outer membrane protein assembly factor BamB
VDSTAQSVATATRQVKQTRSANDKTPLQLFPVDILWTLPLNNPVTAPPAFDGARGFFPIESDQLAAYDLVAGRQLWIAPIRTTVEPAAHDGLLVVVEPESIIVLHAEDGTEVWTLPFDEELAVPPVIVEHRLLFATAAGDVISQNMHDGSLAWRRHLSAPAHARPAAMGDRLFVTTGDSHVIALNLETGESLWDRRLGGPGNDILAADQRLYLGSNDRFFYCLNANTGEVEWRWQTGADAIGRPVIDEHTVYFVALDNVLRALNRSSGVQRWKSALPVRPSTGPLKSLQTIVVAGAAPGLKAYSTKDGKAAGQMSTSSELSAPPYLLADAEQPFPILIVVTSDITGRATVTASTRTVEPQISPLAPLPNPIVVAPAAEEPKDLERVSPLPYLFQMSPAVGR